MKKETYILKHYGDAVAVILAADEAELKEKLKPAIQEEVSAEKDGQFSLTVAALGDWGEDTKIKTSYVNEGELVDDDEFTVMKTVSY